MNISRRHLLATAPLASIALMAGCTTSTVNGVTTVTVNLATVNAYAQAIQNGANTILSVPMVTTAMGTATTALVKAAITGAATAIAQLNTQYKGALSFSFTATTVPADLSALLADATTVNNAVSTVVSSLGSQFSSSVETTIDAIETIVSALIAMVSGAVGAGANDNVAHALAVLGVKA